MNFKSGPCFVGVTLENLHGTLEKDLINAREPAVMYNLEKALTEYASNLRK